jgi:flagellar assembly protein FliH
MPIVKSTTSLAIQPQAYSLRDVAQQAAAMLAKAQQQADALLAQAQVEAEKLRDFAKHEGLVAGHAEGLEKGLEQGVAAGRQQALVEHKAELSTLIKSLSAAAAEIEQSRHKLLHDAADDMVDLAVAIARKTVHQFAARRPQTLIENVTEALRFVVGQNDVRIAVHPSQEQLLKSSLPAIQLRWPNLKHVHIAPDDSIAPGGASIITKHGEVGATLELMIERIAADMLGDEEPRA